MKKFSVIIASLLFFAGATFAQQTGTMPAPKSGHGSAKTTTTPGTKPGSASGTVKKVPAAPKGKATPATKPAPAPSATGTTGK